MVVRLLLPKTITANSKEIIRYSRYSLRLSWNPFRINDSLFSLEKWCAAVYLFSSHIVPPEMPDGQEGER